MDRQCGQILEHRRLKQLSHYPGPASVSPVSSALLLFFFHPLFLLSLHHFF